MWSLHADIFCRQFFFISLLKQWLKFLLPFASIFSFPFSCNFTFVFYVWCCKGLGGGAQGESAKKFSLDVIFMVHWRTVKGYQRRDLTFTPPEQPLAALSLRPSAIAMARSVSLHMRWPVAQGRDALRPLRGFLSPAFYQQSWEQGPQASGALHLCVTAVSNSAVRLSPYLLFSSQALSQVIENT